MLFYLRNFWKLKNTYIWSGKHYFTCEWHGWVFQNNVCYTLKYSKFALNELNLKLVDLKTLEITVNQVYSFFKLFS